MQSASGAAQSLLQEMANQTQLPLDGSATNAQIEALCKAVAPYAAGPSVTMDTDGTLRRLPRVVAYLASEDRRIEGFHDRLALVFGQMDLELVSILRTAANSPFVRLVRRTALSGHPVNNTDLGFLAPSLAKYVDECRAINDYYEGHIRRVVER